MSNRNVYIVMMIVILVILLVATDQYTKNKYSLNIYEYVKYSKPITDEEREYLSKRGTIYFVSDKNAPPFAYIDKNSGQYKGLVLDYASALSIELEVETEFIPKEWEEAVKSVINGDADICDMFSSSERKKYLIFSEPIYKLRAIIMTRKNQNEITDIFGLSGKKVAIPSGDYAIEYINNSASNVDIVETTDVLESINLLLDGAVEAVIGDEPVIMYFTDELGIKDEVNILYPPLYEKDVSLAINKSDPMLLGILNKGILSLKKKEFVEKIQQKWFGLSAPILKEAASSKHILSFIIVITILLIIFALVFIWNYTLKAEVKKRTDELNRSRFDLEMTFNAITNFLIVINDRCIIENVNKAFCMWLKERKEGLIGKSLKSIPLLDYIFLNYGFDVNNGNKNYEQKEVLYKGRHYICTVTPFEYDLDKKLIALEDITDQKISQLQLLQQNKMIAIGQLAAGVAHEMRNPLGLIRNYCYVLKNKIDRKDSLIEKSINVIESSVLRAGKIVDNLLNFSRIGEDEPQYLNLRESISDIVSLESQAISKRGIEIKVNCREDIRIFIKPESLNQIMINLMLNSIDAMPDGGTIYIDCDEKDGYLQISFKDTGIGIEEDNLECIFNPFFTTKKAGYGTGLGLYIVYNEVEKNGGTIQVQSEVGKGTTFILRFPLKEAKDGE